MSMSLRIIKLVTPSNDCISVELGGDEMEFLDLISMIVGVPVSGIKGLKDCYGNYYTISSAINNASINSDHSEHYFLICSANAYGNSNTHKNNGSIIHPNNQISRSPSVNKSDSAQTSNCNKSFHTQNSINKTIYKNNNNTQLNKSYAGLTSHRNSTCQEHFTYPNNTNNNNNTNNTNNMTTMNMNMNQHSVSQSNCTPRMTPDTPSLVDKYLSIAQSLYETSQIDGRIFSKLSQMILKENEEVINLLNIFCHNIIDKEVLLSGLNKIISNFSLCNLRPTSPINIKSKLLNLLEQLENDLILDDTADFLLLKNLVDYDNEFIMGAFEVFEADNDLDNFIESLKILINRSKKKPSLYMSNSNSVNFNKNSTERSQKKKNSLQSSQANNVVTNSNMSNIVKESSENFDNTNESTLFKFKTSPIKALVLTKEAKSQILSCLHTEERIIFKYAMKNKLQDIDVITQLYDAFHNTDLLIKPVKHLCKKFISDNILKHFDEGMKAKFSQIMRNRENNKGLVSIFKEFNENPSIEKLVKDVLNYLKNKNDDKSMRRNDKKSSSDTDSIIEDEESVLKENKVESMNNFNEINNSATNISKLENFLQMIKVMKFLNKEEKKELESLIKSKNKNVLEVFENYYKSKSINSLKNSVVNLLKTKGGGNMSNTGELKNINNYHEETKYNTTTKIFSKPENSDKSDPKFLSFNNIPAVTYITLESLLDDLERQGKISSLQHKYIIQRFKNNDDMVHSAWEIYEKYKDLPELVESLKVFTSNFMKGSGMFITNPPPVTPADLKESKKEIIEFLKSKSHQKEKENVKIMQYNMIKILARDNSIEKNNLPLLKEMILEENPLLISAFDVFGVTKDHKDFSHTINIISYLYNKNGSQKSQHKKTPPMTPEPKENKLSSLFESFLKKGNNFNDKEKEILRRKLSQKNQFLMSSMELFESTGDAEELLDTLKIILKNKDV